MEQPNEPLISLCMIVGNVEEYIERCLDSFKPIADEICVVRAIGNLVPDKTLEIASNKFGARVGEYKNKPAHQSWPHLDDFAAARNQSYDLATGKYIFWADSDDVLEYGVEAIREDAENGKYVVYIVPYKIFGRDVNIQRERMMRRGSGKWVYPVHECFAFDPQVEGALDERASVIHLPHHSKTGSNDRNLRILEAIPENELTPGLKYHLHGELLGVGQIDKSTRLGLEAVQSTDLGVPERYEIFLNLGKIAKNPDLTQQMFHQAYKLDPSRREALGLLTCTAMDYGRPDHALSFARSMMALPPPEKANWNDRNSAYDWLGVDIYTQAVRSKALSCNNSDSAPSASSAVINKRSKLLAEANKHRVELLELARKSGRPIISLIHATRGRPKQAAKARKLWLDLADRPDAIEHIFVFDQDDDQSHILARFHHAMIPAGLGCVGAWNHGAAACGGDILVQMSDDWIPPLQWDTKIIDRFTSVAKPNEKIPPHVLAVSDGHRNDDLLCMAIITRGYYELDYFMFHPRFTGVYSDNWFTREAYRRNAVIDAKDLVFTHDHPFFKAEGRSKKEEVELDDTYKRQNDPARYAEGMAIYNELLEGRDWSTIHGWFNFWALYQILAKQLKDGDVVAEIGVWMGRSIIMLAQECKRLGKKVKLLAVDNFQGEPGQPEHEKIITKLASQKRTLKDQFMDNVQRCGVADMITLMEGDSVKIARTVPTAHLAFCFIDGNHNDPYPRNDITAWLPKVKPNHVIAGHDAEFPDVKKAVLQRFGNKAYFNGSVWMAKA